MNPRHLLSHTHNTQFTLFYQPVNVPDGAPQHFCDFINRHQRTLNLSVRQMTDLSFKTVVNFV